MVQSKWCTLNQFPSREERIELDECPHDKGGYFILNGQEKVIVAQERLSYN